MSDAKMIRFIDSEYNDLFFIPDGANITLTFSNGERVTRPCKYLDSHHTQIGHEALHIYQFAEAMERNGTTYMPEHPPELPDKCFSTMPVSGELVLIEKGKKGYIPCPWCAPEQAEREAAQRNRSLGVTKQQEAAMLGGSLFGWQTHVADVSSYDLRGQPVYPSAQTMPSENSGSERRDDYLRNAEMSTEANYNMIGDGIINNTPPPREDQTYSIYQLKSGDETRDYRFESLGHLEARGLSVDPTLYALVYTAPLMDRDTLDSIFQKFNIDRPSDFTGHSLSVSDIIALRKKDETTAYYVDAFGFREVPFHTVDKEVTIVDDEKRMIQNYEVKTAIHIGGKEVILAEDLASSEPYMVCNCQWDKPTSPFANVTAPVRPATDVTAFT